MGLSLPSFLLYRFCLVSRVLLDLVNGVVECVCDFCILMSKEEEEEEEEEEGCTFPGSRREKGEKVIVRVVGRSKE